MSKKGIMAGKTGGLTKSASISEKKRGSISSKKKTWPQEKVCLAKIWGERGRCNYASRRKGAITRGKFLGEKKEEGL